MSKSSLALVAASAAFVLTLSACNRASAPGDTSMEISPAQFDQMQESAQPASEPGMPESFIDVAPQAGEGATPQLVPDTDAAQGEGAQPIEQPVD